MHGNDLSFRVTIWGARGSIPTPGEATARYGGNTPCVSVEVPGQDGHHLVILDAGTGIRRLGRSIVEAGNEAVSANLILSHTHWDHIQGLPFFAPLFHSGAKFRVFGARQGNVDVGDILRQQMNPVVFPVPLESVAAELTVQHVEPEPFELDGCIVSTMRVRHPGVTLATRLAHRDTGVNLVYVPDNELGPGGEYEVGPGWRERLLEFVGGADVLIHDAMFTPALVREKAGWGHSSHIEAVEFAVDAGVRRLVLFHHNPDHADDQIDAMLAQAGRLVSERGSRLEVSAGHEGMQLNV